MGQLGNGPSYIHPNPVMVPDLPDATQIEASRGRVCAIRRSGVRVCWGHISTPDGLSTVSFAPREVPPDVGRVAYNPLASRGVKTKQMATDDECGVSKDSRLFCALYFIGSNRRSFAGLWKAPSREKFASAAAMTYYRPGGTACGLTESGRIKCFAVGEKPAQQEISSSSIDSLTGVVELLAANSVTCARDSPGNVWCWGGARDVRDGRLGPAPPVDPFEAVRITHLPPATQLAVGQSSVCTLAADGHVWCWGSNREGGVPTGAHGAEETPGEVRFPMD